MTITPFEYEQYHETKSHTDLDFPYTTYLCTIPLDFSHVPPHWHNEFECIIIKKGECLIHIDMISYHAKKGDILLALPGQIHSITQYEQFTVEYENIFFKESFLFSRLDSQSINDALSTVFKGKKTILTHYHALLEYYPSLYDCIKEIDYLCEHQFPYYELRLKSIWLNFFYIILAHSPNMPNTSSSDHRSLSRTKEAILYIQENYTEPLNPDDLATHLGISTSHFMRFFKQSTNMTFTQYLNNYRLIMSSRLLRTSEENILEISNSCGFSSLSYFNRLFKKQFSVTPSEYRRGITCSKQNLKD